MDQIRPHHPTLGGSGAWAVGLILAVQGSRLLAVSPPPSAPATSLEVAVADPAGQPVEGAFVTAFAPLGGTHPSGRPEAEERHAVTGKDGRARLETLPAGPWTVVVHGRGFVTRVLRDVASGPLAVRLDKGGVVTGTVVSSSGRRPVAGAKVVALTDVPVPADWPEEAIRNVAASDAQGRFRLEGIGPSAVTLSVRAAGHAIGQRPDVKAGDRVEVVLFPGSTIRGTVRDDDGRPVSGALVRVEVDRFWGQRPLPERTDAQGRFEMAGVTPGMYEVVARQAGRAPAFGRVVVEPETEATVSLVLATGGFVTGRVVDERGRPRRARLQVEAVDDLGLAAASSDLVATESKDDGTFALGPLPDGVLGLTVSAAQHAPRRVQVHVGPTARTVDLGDVALDVGLPIRGQIRDGQGRGLAGAILTARSEARSGLPPLEAKADAEGAFVLPGLEAGTYRITAKATGHAQATARAEAGGEPLEITLDAGGAIAGRVLDVQGRPVAGASVRTTAREGSLIGQGPPSQEAEAEPSDGSFRLEGLAPGAYDLEARASGHAPVLRADLRVVAGRATEAGILILGRGGMVRGTVVDGDGQGVSGATVYVETDPSRFTEDLASQTDAIGAFEVRGVPAGRALLRVLHPSYAPGGLPEVSVDPASEPVPVRIVLGRGARVEGHVRHRDGRPFTVGRVIVSSSDPGAAYGWPEPIPLDEGGGFVAEHVLPGRAQVHVLAFAATAMPTAAGAVTTLSRIAVHPVELREGETALVDVGLRDVVVSGRVTRGGQAAASVRVRVFPRPGGSISFSGLGGAPPASAGPPALVATTRDDGGYDLLVFAPGPARVALAAASGQGFPGREVVIPDLGRFDLDLELAEATVAGVVVDRDTGAPLSDVLLRLAKGDGHAAGTLGRTGSDGRFAIGTEAGDYVLSAELPGRVRVVRPLSVAGAGIGDLRLEMDKGLAIMGRVLDPAGRPAAGLAVFAIGSDGFERAPVRADGTFRVEGLGDRPYALSVGSALAGFATRPAARPGPEPVTLTLRPAGKVTVRVAAPDGRPVAEAFASITHVDGALVDPGGSIAPPTSDGGATEIACPAGEVGIAVVAESGSGFGTVKVLPGDEVALHIVLRPGPERP